jgi:uncharacterized protein (TIGR03382 family)
LLARPEALSAPAANATTNSTSAKKGLIPAPGALMAMGVLVWVVALAERRRRG